MVAGSARRGTSTAGRSARWAASSPAMIWLARAGLVARGVMYVLIGWIAVQIAFGHSSQQADRTGALRLIGKSPVGSVVLWLLVVGFIGLALWRLSQAIWGAPGADGRKATKRLGALGRPVRQALCDRYCEAADARAALCDLGHGAAGAAIPAGL